MIRTPTHTLEQCVELLDRAIDESTRRNLSDKLKNDILIIQSIRARLTAQPATGLVMKSAEEWNKIEHALKVAMVKATNESAVITLTAAFEAMNLLQVLYSPPSEKLLYAYDNRKHLSDEAFKTPDGYSLAAQNLDGYDILHGIENFMKLRPHVSGGLSHASACAFRLCANLPAVPTPPTDEAAKGRW